VLSLDAPVIAALWQSVFAHDAAVKLSIASRAVLPLAVWLIYLVDRLFDTAHGLPLQVTARHAFHCANRRACYLMAGCAALSAAVGVLYLPPLIVRNGLTVLGAVIAYLSIVHGMGGKLRRWLPKEAAVGLIFSLGSALAPASWSSNPSHLLFPGLVFGILCWANSAAIEIWEGGTVDAVSAFLVRHFRVLAVAVALVCLFGGAWLPLEHSWVACLFAALGYAVIDYLRYELSPDLLRVGIDIPLLAPLLLLGLK